MVTIPLMNPFETRVLPAVNPAPSRAAAPAARPSVPAQQRLALPLRGEGWLEIWDDRVVTSDQIFPLDASFSARVTTDWRAPLTAEPSLGLALRDDRGRWNIYVPSEEERIWQAEYVLRGVCEARGLALPDLRHDDTARQQGESGLLAPSATLPAMSHAPVRLEDLDRHPYEHRYQIPLANYTYTPAAWIAPDMQVAHAPSESARTVEMTSDGMLVAIAHLSLVFLPVLLPLTIWLALRRNVPRVAGQACEAAGFQAIVYCFGALLLGYAAESALTHDAGAAALGLLGFAALIAAGLVYALYGALRAIRGDDFRYLRFFRRNN